MDQIEQICNDWHKIDATMDLNGLAIAGRMLRIATTLEKKLNDNLSKVGLNINDFDILAVLRRSARPHRMTASELLKNLMLTSGGLTNRLDKLTNLGLIERQENSLDKRQVFVKLTGKGLKTVDATAPGHFATMSDTLKSLSFEQQTQLQKILTILN